MLFVAALVAAGFYMTTSDIPQSAAPDAEFDVEGDATPGALVVEYAGGESLSSGSLRILVYEDRPIVPDRPVHGTIWETETGSIQPGNRLELEDPRFEPRQRIVVRWFGDDGRANLHESKF